MERSKGQDLTAHQARELDDEYFGSDPFGYFASRISNLLEAAQSPPLDLLQGLPAQFAEEIGQSDWAGVLAHSDADRELQVALDCFTLRHSAAEALVRLYLAATQHRSNGGSMWQKLTSTPVQTKDLVTQAQAALYSEQGAPFREMVTPLVVHRLAEQEGGLSETDLAGLNAAISVNSDWLERAFALLTDEEMNLDVANNKIKHGIAVRTRDDLLTVFTPASPDVNGNVPISALTGPSSIPVIDTISVDILCTPKAATAKPGWELTTLALRPPTLLAETWLMARTHAALFYVAASRHFGGGTPRGGGNVSTARDGPDPRTAAPTAHRGSPLAPHSRPRWRGGPPAHHWLLGQPGLLRMGRAAGPTRCHHRRSGLVTFQ